MIGNGNNRYQLLDVEDLCRAIFACMTLDENPVNDTFNMALPRIYHHEAGLPGRFG